MQVKMGDRVDKPLIVILAFCAALGTIFFFVNGGSIDEMFYGIGRAVVFLLIGGSILAAIAYWRGWT